MYIEVCSDDLKFVWSTQNDGSPCWSVGYQWVDLFYMLPECLGTWGNVELCLGAKKITSIMCKERYVNGITIAIFQTNSCCIADGQLVLGTHT